MYYIDSQSTRAKRGTINTVVTVPCPTPLRNQYPHLKQVGDQSHVEFRYYSMSGELAVFILLHLVKTAQSFRWKRLQSS